MVKLGSSDLQVTEVCLGTMVSGGRQQGMGAGEEHPLCDVWAFQGGDVSVWKVTKVMQVCFHLWSSQPGRAEWQGVGGDA